MTSWWQKGLFMPRYVTEEYLDRRLDEFEERFEKKLETKFVTKDEFHTRLDEVVTILKRLDQERVFTVEWIRRVESDVNLMKKHLNLV